MNSVIEINIKSAFNLIKCNCLLFFLENKRSKNKEKHAKMNYERKVCRNYTSLYKRNKIF